MKKLFIILVISFLVCNNKVYASSIAYCHSGTCHTIKYSSHYKWAMTDCYEPLVMEEVETAPSSFKIVATGRICTVFYSK